MKPLSGMVDANGDFEHAKELARFFAGNINRRVVVDPKRWYPVRTNQQNKAVMGYWMSIILEEQGYQQYEYDEVYYGIKSQCWFTECVSKKTGEVIKLPRKTSKSDTAEYSEFMRVFRAYVLDFFGIFLPDPVKSLELI
jgi:hypothetical protein